MNLRKYIECLERLVEENPEALDFTLYAYTDDEGNDVNEVWDMPSIIDPDSAWAAEIGPNVVLLN